MPNASTSEVPNTTTNFKTLTMREFQFCHDLGSIEPSKGQPERPRSICQSALYHSFDVEIGRTNWITIKGDHLLRKRIKSTTSSRGLPGTPCLSTVDRALTSTLAIHVVLCEWTGENRRRYMNFLEEALQATTRPALSAMVDPVSQLDTHSRRGNLYAGTMRKF